MKRFFPGLLVLSAALLLIAAGCSLNVRTSKKLDGGVFRSDDGGHTWIQTVYAGSTKKGKPLRIDNIDVLFLRFDPGDPKTIYLGTSGFGVYRSEDEGNTWIKTGLSTGTYVDFVIDPSSTSILYAASGGTILKSTDRATTWSPIYVESRPDRMITDLVVKPDDSSHVLAATSSGDFLLSRDYGNTWRLFSNLGAVDTVSRLFYAEGSTTTLYALGAARGLFRSTDGGGTWVSLAPSFASFPGAAAISSIVTVPGKSDVLYTTSNYGLLQSNDAGNSWKAIQTLVPFGSQPIKLMAVNPQNENILYVIVGNRLRKSDDGGVSWDAKITVPTGRIISTLALNLENPNQLFIGTVKPKKK